MSAPSPMGTIIPTVLQELGGLRKDAAVCASMAKQVHVLFMVDQLSALGGGERAMMQIVRSLSSRFRCSVVTFRGNVHPDVGRLLPVQPKVIPLSRTYSPHALASAVELRRFIRDGRVDIVHTFFETSDIWGGFVARLSGAKVLISSRRDMGFLRSTKHHIAYRLAGRMCDRVLTVSNAVRSLVVREDRLNPSRVTTLYTGISPIPKVSVSAILEARRHLNLPPDAPVVLKIANIVAWKGHKEFLEAAALVHAEHPDAHFVVAGALSDPALFARLMSLRRTLRLDDCFHYLGEVLSTRPLYQLATVVCLLSHTEGLPNVVLEAMSAGRPVVATDVGGTGELIVDGDTGFLVGAGDVKGAANKISLLLKSDRLACEMSDAAVRRVERHFSLERMITQLEGIYDSALRRD